MNDGWAMAQLEDKTHFQILILINEIWTHFSPGLPKNKKFSPKVISTKHPASLKQ